MDIRCVKDFSGLVTYLVENLNWPAGVENLEDIADYMYDFTADDIGIRPEEFAKVESLKQLPPLVEDQLWGIFAVEFASAKFSVTALRRILSRLVPTRRNAANHAVWDYQNLLFFCFWGEGRNSRIMVAHFEETEDHHFLVRAFDCEPEVADPMELKKFKDRLNYLQWPNVSDNDRDPQMWRNTWLEAFDTYYRETITTSAKLAVELARVAKDVKERILATLEAETSNGFIHRLCDKVRQTLVHNLSQHEFADMYAQTIVYGLFSARCMDETPETFSAEEAISLIPTTNPFLKSLMRDCFQRRGRLSFDELGIGDIVELLSHVDANVIADDFGRQTGGGREDPVIHFYEEFLKEYDKAQKIERGVFYTPQPVVTFTVRAVDYLLKTVFGLADGLACDETIKVEKEFKVYNKTKKGNLAKGFRMEKREVEMPRIQLLDPATGTGTYIRQTILQIYENFKQRYVATASSPSNPTDLAEAWSRYVDAHVLPRLYAFELMMAPYAVAHMKLAMVLKDTGYDFKGGERLKVYLTNTLEEPGDADKQMTLDFGEGDPLATESLAANEAKKNGGINIVIGNPPYSGISQNNGEWITKLVDEYKYTNGVYFNERKHWLNDDYVKFIRYGQERIHQAGQGVLAYISNHAFLDNITFRAMRWNLLKEFDLIYVLDLHGDMMEKVVPKFRDDENVFDIKKGVSISIFIKIKGSERERLGRVYYADLIGSREIKYHKLQNLRVEEIPWREVLCSAPNYFFVVRDESECDNWLKCFSVKDLLLQNTSGIVSMGDSFALADSKGELEARIDELLNTAESQAEFTERYNLGKNYASFVYEFKNSHPILRDENYVKIFYRPFDGKWAYFSKEVIWRARENVMRHALLDNVLLIVKRGYPRNDAACGFVSNRISDFRYWSCSGMQGGDYVFPLYLYDTAVEPPSRRVNFDAAIYKKICKEAGLTFSDQDLQATSCKSTPETPQLIFDYIYGVLHSGKYRKKYAEFLKIDFPRVPYPKDGEEFRKMASLGGKLRRIHCMEDFDEAEGVELVGGDGAAGVRALPDRPTVTKPMWKDGCVYIDKEMKFTNVAEDLWNFYIGGYQPLQKWLKDRKGRELSAEDVSHYKRIVRAITQTRDVMAEIDMIYTV